MVPIIYYILLMLFIVLSLFLILLVLIQKGRGGGLASAFGGVGGNTAFGAKTGDVLTWATAVVFGVFLILGIGLNLMADNIHQKRLQVTADTPKSATQPVTPGSGDLTPVESTPEPAPTTPATAPATTTPTP
jgi:preprotein translocase subunit SecG